MDNVKIISGLLQMLDWIANPKNEGREREILQHWAASEKRDTEGYTTLRAARAVIAKAKL